MCLALQRRRPLPWAARAGAGWAGWPPCCWPEGCAAASGRLRPPPIPPTGCEPTQFQVCSHTSPALGCCAIDCFAVGSPCNAGSRSHNYSSTQSSATITSVPPVSRGLRFRESLFRRRQEGVRLWGVCEGGGGAHLPDSASSTADTADCRAPYTRSASACCAAWTAPAAASLPPLLPCVPMYHPNCRSRAHQQQIVCCRTGQLLSSRGPKTVGHCQSAGQMAAAPPCHRALHYNIQNIVYGLSLLRQLL